MRRLAASSLRLAMVALLSVTAVSAAPPVRHAPNPAGGAVDQLVIAGNACGPAALLAAFRCGNEHWQRASAAVPGAGDKERLRWIIRHRGARASAHLPGRPRWTKDGVNVADLCDIANELAAGHYLPPLRHEILFASGGESPDRLLRRVHRQLETSLEKGFPPVVSIRRFVHREGRGWLLVEGHFVTIVAVPRKLSRGERSFPVTYLDPWGGKVREGLVAIPENGLLAVAGEPSPCLEAVFPEALVGRKLVRKGEMTAIAVAAAIGRW